MTERSSSSSSFDRVENVDWISKLPNDALVMILTKLSTEEAIRTSVVSKRWEHVWKQMPHLVFDMHKIINPTRMFTIFREKLDVSKPFVLLIASLITKIINNHCGHLESCLIDHYPYQCEDGTLNTWIQSLKTKNLTLRHHSEYMSPSRDFLDFPSNAFSYPSLTSLSLEAYNLKTSLSFNNCQNLKNLKLSFIDASKVEVFNKVVTSCPSLEVLVLQITCFETSTVPLEIDNNRLKLLKLNYCGGINGIKVSSTSLHILDIEIQSCGKDYFTLSAPRLKFNRNNYWLVRTVLPHIMYNISTEEKCIGHEELLVNIHRGLVGNSLSVSVDLTNPREVERLRQVLLVITYKMAELEILFKNNNALREESESALWDEEEENSKDPFQNVAFRVANLWMHNFSGSKEEFAFVSRLIKQRKVFWEVMIKTSSLPAKKKLEIERAVAKLQTLQRRDQRGQWEPIITCF